MFLSLFLRVKSQECPKLRRWSSEKWKLTCFLNNWEVLIHSLEEAWNRDLGVQATIVWNHLLIGLVRYLRRIIMMAWKMQTIKTNSKTNWPIITRQKRCKKQRRDSKISKTQGEKLRSKSQTLANWRGCSNRHLNLKRIRKARISIQDLWTRAWSLTKSNIILRKSVGNWALRRNWRRNESMRDLQRVLRKG